MATTVSNRLNGAVNGTPDAASLEASAIVGDVEVFNAASGPHGVGRIRFSGASGATVLGLASSRVYTGLSALDQPRYVMDLPETDQWFVRFYLRVPSLQSAGFGINEVRLVSRFAGAGLSLAVHETAAGNIGTRLQPDDLAAAAINWDSETGTAKPINTWWRVEFAYDATGASPVFTSTVFSVDNPAQAPRIHTWNNIALSGPLELYGYRYRRGVLLQPGDNDTTTGGQVSVMQNKLLAWDPDLLPNFGADGDYGGETISAVSTFQAAHSLLVDGIAGPETLAAIDLQAALTGDPNAYPPQVMLSHVAVSDSGPLGPAAPPRRSAEGVIALDGELSAEKQDDTNSAMGQIGIEASLGASKATSAGPSGQMALVGSVPASKAVTVPLEGVIALRASATVYSDSALSVDYAAGHIFPPFRPVDDDATLVNSVRATRRDGGEFSFEKTTGPLSTAEPPEGVGVYASSTTLDVYTDAQLGSQASWRVWLGTVDDYRYPQVRLNLVANPELIDAVSSRDTGSNLQILNPPPWLPPENIDLMIEGYTETINTHRWDIEFAASEGRSWIVGEVLGEEDGEPSPPGENQSNRADTAGCRVVGSVPIGATSITVQTTRGPRWITTAEFPDEFPFDIRVGGEVMRVTDITGTSNNQQFTVLRGMGSVELAHSNNTQVSLYQPAIIAL